MYQKQANRMPTKIMTKLFCFQKVPRWYAAPFIVSDALDPLRELIKSLIELRYENLQTHGNRPQTGVRPGFIKRVHEPEEHGVKSGFIKRVSSVSVRHTVGSGDYFQRLWETSRGGLVECVSETLRWSLALHTGPSPSADSTNPPPRLDKQRNFISAFTRSLLWNIRNP